jgi:acyl-homoserine lactone acylase PvdQ
VRGHYPLNGWSNATLWQGFIPYNEMVYSINPDKGWLAFTNNLIASENYKWHKEYDSDFRYGRIERLAEIIKEGKTKGHKFTARDMINMTLDVKDVPT